MVWSCFSWFGLGLLVQWKEILMLQHTVTFETILCFQLYGSSFLEGPFVFQHDNAPVHSARSIQKSLVQIGEGELDWPAQTSTSSNTFGMNWNANCETGLITQHQCPTSLMLVAEWK
jgi:hypothetical protein